MTATENIAQILSGHKSFETAYEVENYPYGYTLKCKKRTWIETNGKKGDRLVTCTENPKTGRWNSPKAGTYSPFLYMYIDTENGHVQCGGLNARYVAEFPKTMQYLKEVIGVENVSEAQQKNLRAEYSSQYAISASWRLKDLEGDERAEAVRQHKANLAHIMKAPFGEITNLPEAIEIK